MAGVVAGAAFLDLLKRSRLFAPEQLAELRRRTEAGESVPEVLQFGREAGWLTVWQARQLETGHCAFFLGHYKLTDRLGVGGRGVVYHAIHLDSGREVALKILSRDLVDKPEAVQRFQREVQLASALNHPNVVAAYDAQCLGKLHFLVMEYVPGQDVAAWLDQCGKLPAPWACEIIRQAAEGLQHAHEHGMVHRDIKPGNIMVTARELGDPPIAKILDLGFARTTAEAPDGQRITQPGQVFGTPDYMSPEQAQDASVVDIRSDVFSLGCTLFKMLTGQYPFPGDTTMKKLLARLKGSPVRLRKLEPDLPEGLEAVVLKFLARDIDERYQTPAEAAAALEPYCGHGKVPVAAAPAAQPIPPPSVPSVPVAVGTLPPPSASDEQKAPGGSSAAHSQSMTWTPPETSTDEEDTATTDPAVSARTLSMSSISVSRSRTPEDSGQELPPPETVPPPPRSARAAPPPSHPPAAPPPSKPAPAPVFAFGANVGTTPSTLLPGPSTILPGPAANGAAPGSAAGQESPATASAGKIQSSDLLSAKEALKSNAQPREEVAPGVSAGGAAPQDDGFAVTTDAGTSSRRTKRGEGAFAGWASRLTWRQGLACGAACGGLAGALAGGLIGGLGAGLGLGAIVVPAVFHGLSMGAAWGGTYGALACREAAERASAGRGNRP